MDEPSSPHRFASVDTVPSQQLMAGIRARPLHGSDLTLAVVELDPGLNMPEHRHVNEQAGIVLRGELTFTINGETRALRPGDSYMIPSGLPHGVETTGPDGCTVIDIFTPPRNDWASIALDEPSPGRWPER